LRSGASFGASSEDDLLRCMSPFTDHIGHAPQSPIAEGQPHDLLWRQLAGDRGREQSPVSGEHAKDNLADFGFFRSGDAAGAARSVRIVSHEYNT
jgi:hypothetical protein